MESAADSPFCPEIPRAAPQYGGGHSTVGSIAGVFVSGYILIDLMHITHIFQATGVVVAAMGVASLFVDRWLKPVKEEGATV